MSGVEGLQPSTETADSWHGDDERHGPYEAHHPGEVAEPFAKDQQLRLWRADEEITLDHNRTGEQE